MKHGWFISLLWFVFIAEILGAVFVARWGVRIPERTVALREPNGIVHDVNGEVADENEQTTLEGLATVWNRLLQAPLFDPPPKEVVAENKPAPPPFRASLIGTLIGTDEATAMFTLPDGAIRFCSVGEKVGAPPVDAEVLTIVRTEVKLRYHDQEITLQVPVSF